MTKLSSQTRALLERVGVDPARITGGSLEVRSPTNGEVIAVVQEVSASGTAAAIGRAHDGFMAWRGIPAPRRGELVRCCNIRNVDVIYRRDGKISADPTLCLASRCDGGADTCVGVDPRGNDGNGRRLYDRASESAFCGRAKYNDGCGVCGGDDGRTGCDNRAYTVRY